VVELKALEMKRIDWPERRPQSPGPKSDAQVNRASFASHLPENISRSLEISPNSKIIHSVVVNAPDRKPTQIRIISRDVGVVLELTPQILPNREMGIDMKTNVEIRPNPQTSFTTQTVRQTVRLAEGERIIVGGFITDAEARSLIGMPALKDNAILHYLFSDKRGQPDEPELVLMLSPRIVGSPEIHSVDAPSRPVDTPTRTTAAPARPAGPPAGTVGTPAPAIVAPVRTVDAPSSRPKRSLYTVQVGAFESAATAETLRARLNKRYEGVFVQQFTDKRTLYRVRVGRVPDVKTAKQLERQLRAEGLKAAVIVPVDE
jgi:cell division septation protein DedD